MAGAAAAGQELESIPHLGRDLNRAREAEAIRPNHIDLYTARAGDTWQAIAERAGSGVVKLAFLGVIAPLFSPGGVT